MKDFAAFLVFLFSVAVIAVAGIGWVLNIAHLVASISAPITALFILRVVGIFALPLGAILGWVT